VFVFESSEVLFEPARTLRAMLGLAYFTIAVVAIILWIRGREARINILRDEDKLLAHSLLTA
jgi:hypothetical protein